MTVQKSHGTLEATHRINFPEEADVNDKYSCMLWTHVIFLM